VSEDWTFTDWVLTDWTSTELSLRDWTSKLPNDEYDPTPNMTQRRKLNVENAQCRLIFSVKKLNVEWANAENFNDILRYHMNILYEHLYQKSKWPHEHLLCEIVIRIYYYKKPSRRISQNINIFRLWWYHKKTNIVTDNILYEKTDKCRVSTWLFIAIHDLYTSNSYLIPAIIFLIIHIIC
jgi:hypothetical protein